MKATERALMECQKYELIFNHSKEEEERMFGALYDYFLGLIKAGIFDKIAVMNIHGFKLKQSNMNLEEEFYDAIVDMNRDDITMGELNEQCVKIAERFAIGFSRWLKINAYSKDDSWYLHESMDGNIYSESDLLSKYTQHLKQRYENSNARIIGMV